MEKGRGHGRKGHLAVDEGMSGRQLLFFFFFFLLIKGMGFIVLILSSYPTLLLALAPTELGWRVP